MGAIELHLERVDDNVVTHEGVRELGKSYGLAQVVGFPTFRRVSVADSGPLLPRLKSSSDHPHTASPEVHRAATGLADIDKGRVAETLAEELGFANAHRVDARVTKTR